MTKKTKKAKQAPTLTLREQYEAKQLRIEANKAKAKAKEEAGAKMQLLQEHADAMRNVNMAEDAYRQATEGRKVAKAKLRKIETQMKRKGLITEPTAEIKPVEDTVEDERKSSNA